MPTTRKESTTIGGVAYTTETYIWSEGADIYAQVGAALPDKVLSLIMLPVSSAIEAKRLQRARKDARENGSDDATDAELELGAGLATSIQELATMLESPRIMAQVAGEVMKSAADLPGGISELIKRVLFKTSANPIRVAAGGGGHREMLGGEGMLVPNIETHFSGTMKGMMDSLAVCVWVLRTNFAEPSSGGA